MDKIIPDGWQIVNFGDVVNKINDRVPNRDEWTFDKFVSGGHIDSEQIRVTKFSPILGNEEKIGSAFHMRFQPGHVLYVSRRAYLRKGGMVEFEGICSNTTFILQAEESQLLQSLVPFIIQTEDFVKHTTDNSHGSTNPFLNWKDIAKYKLLLPSFEEQKKISEILWSIEENTEKNESLINATEVLKRGFLNELLTKGINHAKFKPTEIGEIPEEWDVVCLNEIVDLKKQKANPPYNSQKYVALEHIDSGETTQMIFGSAKDVKSLTHIFKTGDLLYGKLRPYLNKAAVATFDGICSTEILVLDANEKTSNEFLIIHLKSDSFIKYNINLSFGTKMPRTSFKIMSKYKIPLPPREEQDEIIGKFSGVDSSISKLVVHGKNLDRMKKKLTNDFLSGKLIIPKEVL